MNIVLATDDRYIQHCAVTMTSIVSHNKSVNFFVVTEGLTYENKQILYDIIEKAECRLDFCYVDSNIISQLPMPTDPTLAHISVATYYRLFLAELLPADIHKVLYLDCDMIIKGSLEPLWEEDIKCFANAAVFQPDGSQTDSCLKRLNISRANGYFNAGMQLINIDYWKENSIQSAFLNYLRDNRSIIVYHDQDVMNAVLQGKTKGVSLIWNMFLSEKPKREIVFGGISKDVSSLQNIWDNCVIVHYTSSIKPWRYLCSHPLAYLYYDYLAKTVFHDYKPQFDKQMLWYRIKVCINKLFGRI